MLQYPRRRILVSAAFLAGLSGFPLPHTALVATQPAQPVPATLSTTIQGRWQVSVTFVDGPQAGQSDVAKVYIGQNNVFASLSTSEPLLAGWGLWAITGAQSFWYGFHEVALSPTNEMLFLVHVSAQARLTSGSSFTASGEGKVYSLDGTYLGLAHTEVQGIRVA